MSQATTPMRISGRVFVPWFVAAMVIGISATIYWAFKLQPMRKNAFEKTFPLAATLDVSCKSGAVSPADLHTTGRCPSAGELILSARDAGADAKQFAWAIVGQGDAKPIAGRFALGESSTAKLTGLAPGTYVLTFVISDKQAEPQELLSGIGMAVHPDIPDRLVAIEQFATLLRHRNMNVLTQRIEFKVE